MVYIACALYQEAEPFIKEYDMNVCMRKKGITVYSSDCLYLVITGYGNVISAAALSAVLTEFPPKKEDCFINIGSAAGKGKQRGRFYVGNKLIEAATGRCFYPDMILGVECEETLIYTSPVFVDNVEDVAVTADNFVCDMEAAALYQVAEKYFYQDRMIFLKYVSDTGTHEAADIVIGKDAKKRVVNLIMYLKNISETEDAESIVKMQIFSACKKLETFLNASVSMCEEIEKLLSYRQLKYGDAEIFTDEFLKRQETNEPVVRKNGKRLLVDFREEIKHGI